jgi:hypothetical protein
MSKENALIAVFWEHFISQYDKFCVLPLDTWGTKNVSIWRTFLSPKTRLLPCLSDRCIVIGKAMPQSWFQLQGTKFLNFWRYTKQLTRSYYRTSVSSGKLTTPLNEVHCFYHPLR